MKSWEVLFRMARAGGDGGAQGGSTSDDDFTDPDSDDAAAEDGAAELDTDDEASEESASPEEEQSDKDQDDPEETEEEVEEQEEEAPAAGFKFKDPKTGNFDFKRINKVAGGDELEKAFKEQEATITRTFQELKTYKERESTPDFKTMKYRADLLDRMYNENPKVRAEVNRVLHGGDAGQDAAPSGDFALPPGINPEDPLVPLLQQQQQTIQAINNRLMAEDRQRQQQESQGKFRAGLEGAAKRFLDLTGKEMTVEQAELVAKDMQENGVYNGARFVPDLFFKEIQDAATAKFLADRKVKKNLPSRGGANRRPAGGSRRPSREEEHNNLWQEHMGSDD